MKEKSLKRLLRNAILLIFVSLFLVNCVSYDPTLYQGYDVLNPNDAVKKNPLGTVEYDAELKDFVIKWDYEFIDAAGDYFIVDGLFLQWIKELREEVEKLRKK